MRAPLELAAVFLCLASGLSVGASGAGVSWDEVTYFDFSDHVRAWWNEGPSFREDALKSAWAFDRYLNPHPPFMRVLSSLTSSLPLPFPLNYRLATVLVCAGLLTLAFGLVRKNVGAGGALLVVVATVFQPRVYGDVINATADAPVALAYLVLSLLAWRLAESAEAERRVLRAGLFGVYALATATKFTGFLAMAPVGAYFLWRKQWKEVAWTAGSVAAALVFFVATSPDHWHHPVEGIASYLTYPFTRSSVPIATFYEGKIFSFALPWHYFDVMTAVTTPLPILLALPFAPWARAQRTLLAALAFPLAFWLLLVHLPNTPRHDGVRQFLAVMPLLGAVATLGFLGLAERLNAALGLKKAILATAGASLVGLFAPWAALPLSSYNEFVGGLSGAEARGFEINCMLEALTPEVLEEVNQALSPGDTVRLAPEWPELLLRYQREGKLRSDVKVVFGQGEVPRFLLLVRRRSMVVDSVYQQLPAVFEARHEGVSTVKLTRL